MVEHEPVADATIPDLRWKMLYRFGALAAFVQLACTVMTATVVFTLGGEPTTAEEYYTLLGDDRLTGILRLDFASLINVSLFAVASFAAIAALQKKSPVHAAFGTALVFVGVAIALATHSAFSMIHLSDQYAAAMSDAQRLQLLAAGEAVIASGWWESSGGFMAGLFLQGGSVVISIIMLRSGFFSKMTAYAGILCNGLDFVHVLLGLVLPTFAEVVLMIGGVFYLVWFPSLGRDFFKLGRLGPTALRYQS
jgi:hypothetical protein